MKKYYFLIIVALILGLVLTGCSLLSNISQVPPTEQSGISYLMKGLPSGLVGWWRFNGNADDSSGYNNHGTVIGADYESSPMGQALSFDGLNDYVEVQSNPSLQLSSKGTIEFLFNPGIGFGGHDAFILKGVATGTGGATDLDYGVNRHSHDGSIKGWISDHSGLDIIYTTTKTWTVGEWYHIAFTWSGDELKIYVNGVSDATPVSQTRNAYVSTDTATMGRIRGHWYNGLIDDIRIWNVALSEGQLGKIYDFNGFFPPVENLPMSNVVKAGRAIPVKFSLNGDQGLEIFEDDYPKSVKIDCVSADLDATTIEGTDAAGGSSLSYDATDDQYTYVWKTEKDWAGDCRQLVVKLIDGTSHVANFTFK